MGHPGIRNTRAECAGLRQQRAGDNTATSFGITVTGMVVNNGGGRYSIQRSWLDNPGGVVVRSNFGGVATASTLP